jgi:peroxiredoxin
MVRGGGAAKLTELLGPEATVVVFWSRNCGASIAAMPRIATVAGQLAAAGVPVLAVTGDRPAAAAKYLDESGFDFSILFDVEGALGQALNNWETPQYYVLDGAGRLRFVSSLDALLRHTMALRESF